VSYIFDALRKSESERQREVATSLSHAPLARPRQRVPIWAWLVIATLSLALAALALAWWQGREESPSPTPSLAPDIEPPSPALASEPAPISPPVTAPPTETSEASTPRLRPISELASFDPSLPEYRLDVLAPSSRDPAESSAWINGRRYYAGERIGNGPVVLEVRADGVVLALAGERFLLTTR